MYMSGTFESAAVPELATNKEKIPFTSDVRGAAPKRPISKQVSDTERPPEQARNSLERATEPTVEKKVTAPSKWNDLKSTTWNQLERGEVVNVDPPAPKRLVKFLTDPVHRGMQSGTEKAVMGGVLAVLIALVGLMLAFVRSALQF